MAPGGASTIAPTSSAFAATVAGREIAQINAALSINLAHRGQGAVQPDRAIPTGLPQQGDQPLALAQRVAAHHVRPAGEQRHAIQQLLDFMDRIGVHEHRQREGRLGDENVARHGLERHAGRVGLALVVAADNNPRAAVFDHHLRTAQHMAGRDEPNPRLAQRNRLVPAQRLTRLTPVA